MSEMSGTHGELHLHETPVAVPLSKGKYDFFDWTVELHNRVNLDCGKPAYDPQVARMIYEHGYGWGISPYMLFMCASSIYSVSPCFSSGAPCLSDDGLKQTSCERYATRTSWTINSSRGLDLREIGKVRALLTNDEKGGC
jgi:hypothetical protein